ncbi:MAG: UDP-glucose 4-epimerase GalE [Candidatus Eisenbacteria bacterium]|uniref:UDP-glucose 4-epimerase n=1 Tax=Eiseniibacteriota bacterium TaxID=2212470 RepID=A0A538U9Q4_UNCEI|nr:MAG: UDP-glucose 4-epimerase GalE [Candidatus Eisenbacteria bacterium]
MNVLITGGAGYIGSHAAQRLLRDGHTVAVVDNLSRGHRAAVAALQDGANGGRLAYAEADIADRAAVEGLITAHGITVVMHFAAFASVGESAQDPLLYYRNNVSGMIALLEACAATGIERFVFSSSCSTYGQPPEHLIPTPEDCPQAPISPYGMTKLHGEHLLGHYAERCRAAGRPFAFAALRYFNVAGADRGGRLGEDHDPETHLIPVVLQAALGRRERVAILGTDYPTPDGTCVRDYIHVEDLVDAHVAVMQALRPSDARAYNLGIGKGYSVREIIDAARAVTARPFEVVEAARRPGDPPRLYADPARIEREIGWRASVTDLHTIIASAYAWFRDHPTGYGA